MITALSVCLAAVRRKPACRCFALSLLVGCSSALLPTTAVQHGTRFQPIAADG